MPELDPVINEAVAFREQQLASMESLDVTITVDVGSPPPTRPKRSRWRRLLERD
jgi:hypothetical protein